MTYTKTEWKDLPDTTTPITASRLNNIEDGVEYLFDTSALDLYSTTEVETNKRWANDEPIYRKVIYSSTAGELSGVVGFQLNISSFGQIVDIKYFFLNNNAWHFKIPEIKRIKVSQSGVVSAVAIFEMETDASFSYDERYMIVEYTKTTS